MAKGRVPITSDALPAQRLCKCTTGKLVPDFCRSLHSEKSCFFIYLKKKEESKCFPNFSESPIFIH